MQPGLIESVRPCQRCQFRVVGAEALSIDLHALGLAERGDATCERIVVTVTSQSRSTRTRRPQQAVPHSAQPCTAIPRPRFHILIQSPAHGAISSASGGRSVGNFDIVRKPTIRREDTSVTNAVNAMPDHFDTYVKLTTRSKETGRTCDPSFGRSTGDRRCARGAAGSGRVVTICSPCAAGDGDTFTAQ